MELTKSQKHRLEQLTHVKEGDTCPHCTFGLIRKFNGKYGEFLGCDDFPNCAFKQNVLK